MWVYLSVYEMNRKRDEDRQLKAERGTNLLSVCEQVAMSQT